MAADLYKDERPDDERQHLELRQALNDKTIAYNSLLIAHEKAMEERLRLEKERNLLAERIAKLGIKAGIINDQSLTGPQLDHICDILEGQLTSTPSTSPQLGPDPTSSE